MSLLSSTLKNFVWKRENIFNEYYCFLFRIRFGVCSLFKFPKQSIDVCYRVCFRVFLNKLEECVLVKEYRVVVLQTTVTLNVIYSSTGNNSAQRMTKKQLKPPDICKDFSAVLVLSDCSVWRFVSTLRQ